MALTKIIGDGYGAGTITTADNNPQLTLTTTDADAGTGPTLDLFRNSASPADADVGGKISFTGQNDAGETLGMAIFQASHVDVSDGTEDAKLAISSRSAGSMLSRLNLDATETVFNEDSADIDFRVETNALTHTLFVEGSTDSVLIGQSSTTIPGAGNTTAGIAFRGSIGDAFFSRTNGTAGYFNTNQDGNVLTVSRSGTGVGGINVDSSSATFLTSSDYRLKENVTDMTGAIDRVKALAPKRFNFIVDSDKTVDGFLAHEAQTVVPEAISGTKDAVDDDGNAVMQGIDQSKLVPLLPGALKEAVAKIDALEARVKTLEDAD